MIVSVPYFTPFTSIIQCHIDISVVKMSLLSLLLLRFVLLSYNLCCLPVVAAVNNPPLPPLLLLLLLLLVLYGDRDTRLSWRLTSLTGICPHTGSFNALSTMFTSLTLNCSSMAMTGTRDPRSGACTGNDMYCSTTFLR